MRAICLLLLSTMTIVSCKKDSDAVVSTKVNDSEKVSQGRRGHLLGKLDVSQFSKIQKIGLTSQLKASLETSGGVSVRKISQVLPNTTYQLRLEGKGADKIEVRSCFGFEILSKKEEGDRSQLSVVYLIKTQSDVTEPLFVSFLPLRTAGAYTFREKPQNFWLAGEKGDN